MAKKIKPLRVRDRPVSTMPQTNFCPVCGEQLKAKQHGFCKNCIGLIRALPAGKRTFAYCRRGAHVVPEDRDKHGFETISQLERTVDGKISVLIYEDERGCPYCPAADFPDPPHAIIKRVPAPPDLHVA